MLSDTLFDSVQVALKDIAHYAVNDATRDDFQWYEPDQYDEAIRRLAPIMDMQIALDCGYDPMPLDQEAEDHIVWLLIANLIDIIQSKYGFAE